MPLTLLLSGALLAVVGYFWICLLIVREMEARAIVLAMLFIGCFTFIAIAFAWYFSAKRWDIAKRPFLMHAMGLLMMSIGFWLTPS